MIPVRGQGDIDDIFGEFPQGSFLVMTDVTAGRRGINHHHVTRTEHTTKDRFVGIGATDRSDFGVIAFEQNFQIGLKLIFYFIDI